MPNEGVLPLRYTIDVLPDQCIDAGSGKKRECRIADTCAIFRLLIQRGASVETSSVGIKDRNDAKTPLLVLCGGARIFAFIRCLIEEGANVKAANGRGFTPLHLCMISTRYESEQAGLARFLLDRGADASAVTNEGDTPLHLGASRCAVEGVKVLLDRGADVMAKNCRGQSALHAILTNILSLNRENIVDCLEVLLAAGANVYARDASGRRAFMRFVENTYDRLIFRYAVSESARMFLRNVCSLFTAYGAQLYQASINGNTLAHVAAELDDIELLRMYVEYGGEVGALHSLFGTPLSIALRNNRDKILPELLRLGAHLDAGRDGANLFRRFVKHGDAGTVKEKATKSSTHCRKVRR